MPQRIPSMLIKVFAGGLLFLSCRPESSGPAGIADSRLLARDAATLADRTVSSQDTFLSPDSALRDRILVDQTFNLDDAGSLPEAGAWSEDAGVAYAPDCLNDENKTLAVCFADAQNRASAAGPRQLRWTRAVAMVDSQGLIQDSRAGVSYTFCYADAGAFECLVVDYWWGQGGTAQVSLTRLHRVGVGEARSRLLNELPDSPALMVAFTALPQCEMQVGDFAQVSRYAEAGQDRVQIVNGSDSAVFVDDTGLSELSSHCVE